MWSEWGIWQNAFLGSIILIMQPTIYHIYQGFASDSRSQYRETSWLLDCF